MSDGIYAALSGAVLQGTILDNTAANVSNASTAGFHAVRPVFREVLARAGRQQKGSIRLAAAGAEELDMTSGTIQQTGRPLDVALGGKTFLALQTARGERYTRAGALALAKDGTLLAPSGDPVLSEVRRPIKVDPAASLSIAPNGDVTSGGAVVGRLRVVAFEKPEALTPEGATVLAPGGAGAPSPSKEPLDVGALEQSNASPVRAMTDLIQASRAFEAFQRAIETFHDADRKVVSTVPAR